MSLVAVATTVVPIKLKIWWKQRVRWGVGGLQCMLKYKKSFFRKGMFGWFIMPFVLTTILLSIFGFLFGMYILIKTFFHTYLIAEYSSLANVPFFDFSTAPTPSFIFLMA